MPSLITRRPVGFVVLALAILVGGWVLATPVMPVVAAGIAYVVTTTDDTPTDANCLMASCTLRQAVNASNAHDPGAGNQNTITFASGVSGTIAANTHGTLTLSTSVAISGPTSGAGVTVSGGNAVRIFRVNGGVTANLSNLTFANGNVGGGGGAIYNASGGTLTVTNSTFSGNSAPNGSGGGISNDGTLTVTNSTLSGNSATNGSGGGIFNQGTLTVTNSTLSGNSSTGAGGGGGIDNNSGMATVTNSTLSGNSATNSSSGGIYNGVSSTLIVTNSTITGNNSSFGGAIYNANTLNLTNTIVSGNTGGDLGGNAPAINNHNLIGGTPLLGPLASNGGTTPTIPLLAGSPAIGAGDATVTGCASTGPTGVNDLDQRGLPRSPTTCSQGAFEPQQATYAVGATSDSGGAGTFTECQTPGNTSCRLRDALLYASSGQDTIVFNGTGRGTITLGSTLTLTTSVTITGSTIGAGVTVNGGGTVRVFVINSGVTASVSKLTIANGNASGGSGNGGGILNNGTLTVTKSTFSGNTASQGGFGGGILNAGTLTVTNSTFSGNTAGLGGGIVNQGTLTVTNSTVSGNTGGIFNNNATLNLTNTIISGNTGGDLGGNAPAINSHNLIGGTALLGPLASNGGNTQTMALLPGSPAIAHGDPTVCAAAPVGGLDQRGVTRPTILCAIGAFEPLLSAISPTTGITNGLALVTLTGAGFAAGATVTIGTVPCGNVNVVNSTTLTCTTGAHAAGTVDVVVTVGSQTGTLPGGYTYGVVNALPPVQPSGGVGGPTNPLPAPRPAGTTGGPAPNPLPNPRP